jgi:hypothetical protein
MSSEGMRLAADNSPRAHRLVAYHAKALCHELYDAYAQKMDGFVERHPSEKEFVASHWFLFIEQSRAMLAGLLATNIREELKESIFEALIRDKSLEPTRAKYVQVKFDL